MELTFFGSPWDVPIFRHSRPSRVATPVGETCLYCTEKIRLGDRGWIRPIIGLDLWDQERHVLATEPIHRECELVLSTSPLAHVQGRCTGDQQCYELMVVEGRTLRQDALATWDWVTSVGAWTPAQLEQMTARIIDELTRDPDRRRKRKRKEPEWEAPND